MKYKAFKDISLSMLGMGNMRLPVYQKDGVEIIDEAKAKEIIDQAMAFGVNYYDTAYIYHGGESESFLGRALSSYPRDTYYVADKFNYQANPDYKKQFQEQLERLQMDRIDFYLIHGIQDFFVDEVLKNGCISYFDKLKKEGKISYLGFSFHGSVSALRTMLEAYPWDFVQIQLNYYDWYYEDAKTIYEILDQAKIPVMVMEPAHGGMLSDLGETANKILKEANPDYSITSWAMRWVKSLPRVQVILSGMSNTEQLLDNIDSIAVAPDITEEETVTLKNASEIVRKNVVVPCTRCKYCVKNCPQGLDIPLLLSQYNNAKIGGIWRLNNLTSITHGKGPDQCLSCGACTFQCPQHFDIPKYMAELAEMVVMQ